MSTTINVTVGGNGLLDQSRQQMQANRFGHLEQQADQKTAKQAADLRPQPLIDGKVNQRRRIPEPAAYRQAGGYPVASAFIKGLITGVVEPNIAELIIKSGDQNAQLNLASGLPTSINRTRVQTVDIVGRPESWRTTNPSDPGYVPLPISWTGTLTISQNNFANSTLWPLIRRTAVLALPAGGKNLILYYRHSSADLLAQGDAVLSGTADVVETAGVRTANVTVQVDSRSVDVTVTPYEAEHCVVVGPSGVRAISVPAAFKAAVKAFAPDYALNPIWIDSVAAPGTTWMVQFVPAADYYYFGSVIPNESTTPATRYYLSTAAFDNVYSYGLCVDQNGSGMNPRIGSGAALWTTPAVFEMLRSPGQIEEDYDNADYSTRYSFAHVRDNVLDVEPSASNVPADTLVFNLTGETEARFDRSKILPEGWYQAPDPPYQQNNRGAVLTVPVDEQYDDAAFANVYAWDWGKPRYCRDQLLALGFSSEDLSP